MTEHFTLTLKNLPFPPGTNHAYALRSNRMFLTKEAQGFKELVYVSARLGLDRDIPAKTPLGVRVTFYCTPKELNKRDIDGSLKLLIDAIFQAGGGNDAWVRKLDVEKVAANHAHCDVYIWQLEREWATAPVGEVRVLGND